MPIVLEEGQKLIELSQELRLETKVFEKKILSLFYKETDNDACDYEDVGISISDFLDKHEISIIPFFALNFNRYSSKISALCDNVVLLNSKCDCPECGIETEYVYDYDWKGRQTEQKECPKCGLVGRASLV